MYIGDEIDFVSHLIVKFTRRVGFRRTPVNLPPVVGLGVGDHRLNQRPARALVTRSGIDKQVFQIADRLIDPGVGVFDDATGELLGAHMIGAEVTELIQGYGIAMELETTEAELMHTVFAHPTLSEMMHESVLDAFGRAVHF